MPTIPSRAPYPSDVADEEWASIAPYLTLLAPDALQRKHALREVFNALRYLAHGGVPRRMLPHDLPPWPAVYQRARRWMDAGCFAAAVHDLRRLLRVLKGRAARPTAAILDARVLQSSPESGARAGDSGAKRRNGSKGHAAVDPLGHLLALAVTPASAGRAVTGQHVGVAHVDEGDTGDKPAAAAAKHGIELLVVKLPEAKRGFVLLPTRWVVERSFAWAARFRRRARDFARLSSVLAGLHFLAFACLMLHQLIHLYSRS